MPNTGSDSLYTVFGAWRCENCSNINHVWEKCLSCRVAYASHWRCLACGNKNPDSISACGRCSEKYVLVPPEAPPPPPAQPEAKPELDFGCIAQGALVACSLGAGACGANRVTAGGGDTAVAVVVGILIAFLYPFVGAVAVNALRHMSDWAFPEDSSWKDEHEARMLFGALWPIVLPIGAIICWFVGVSRRLFH